MTTNFKGVLTVAASAGALVAASIVLIPAVAVQKFVENVVLKDLN